MTAIAAFQPGEPITPPPTKKNILLVTKLKLQDIIPWPIKKQTWVAPTAAQIQAFNWGAVV